MKTHQERAKVRKEIARRYVEDRVQRECVAAEFGCSDFQVTKSAVEFYGDDWQAKYPRVRRRIGMYAK